MFNLEVAKGWAFDIALGWEDDKIPEYQVDKQRLQHLAIICDGNRRAALEFGFEPEQAHFGHLAGVEVTRGVARAVIKWGINTTTFWVFSTSNWSRRKDQVNFIMDLAAVHLSRKDFLDELAERQVRFTHLGRKDRLSPILAMRLKELEKVTGGFTNYRLNLGLDYGGPDEIIRAYEKLIRAISRNEVNLFSLKNNPQSISLFLDTSGQLPVDLVVRTGMVDGDLPHTSGFMPLQTENAAWDFLPVVFPNLTPEILLNSIQKLEGYHKRMGK